MRRLEIWSLDTFAAGSKSDDVAELIAEVEAAAVSAGETAQHALEGIVTVCERPTWRLYLRSNRHFSARSQRYISARVANDGR